MFFEIKDFIERLNNEGITAKKVISEFYQNSNQNKVRCPFHKDTNKSLSVKKNNDLSFWKCFGCEKSGDQVGFVALYENVDNKTACRLINERFNLNFFDNNFTKTTKKRQTKKIKKEGRKFEEKQIIHDFTEKAILRNKYDNGGDYWISKRKLHPSVVLKYRLSHGLAHEVTKNRELFPASLHLGYYPLIIPIWYNGKVISIICRRREPSNKYDNYLNLKGTPVYISNLDIVSASEIKKIFICESTIDALSIESIGYRAIALNSTSNKKYLIDYMRYYKDKISKDKIFVLCGDNDNSGKEMNLFLKKELDLLKYISYTFEFKEYNDINEMLVEGVLKEKILNKENYKELRL